MVKNDSFRDDIRIDSYATGNPSLLIKSSYSRDLVLVLCCLGFFGFAGIHRFYFGKVFTGLLLFVTGGFFGLGTLYDLFHILKGSFEDGNGLRILHD